MKRRGEVVVNVLFVLESGPGGIGQRGGERGGDGEPGRGEGGNGKGGGEERMGRGGEKGSRLDSGASS